MQVIQVVQGSKDWLQLRSTHDTASEAPAALGKSKYQSRSDLLKQKTTGTVEDVGHAKQALFDRGHASEAAARPLAEAIIGADLYPITTTLEIDGLKLLASLDGATMDEEIIWEHKLFSEALSADVRAGTLHPHYTIQMDQQLLVSGAKKCLFMTSDGTEKNMAWCWYESSQAKFDALIAGWRQFKADLAAYVPAEVIMPAVAVPQMGLPAVSIQVNGSIALVDNLDKFGAALTAYIERINKAPQTDQDFADLESTVKALKAAEDALEAAENGALAQTASIDTMRRTVGLYRDTARTNRLLVEKLVKAEKENRRTAIVGDAGAELVLHVKALNTRLGKTYMPTVAGDFAGVVKGLKSLDSMKDKVAGELARCKIEANATADRIQANLVTLGAKPGMAFLFPDVAMLVLKQPDDLAATVTARITQHEAAEAAKEAALVARIEAEAKEKAEREAREKLATEQAAAVAAEKLAKDQADSAARASVVLVDKAEADRNANAFVDRIEQQEAPAITHDAVVQIMTPATVRQAMAPKPQTPPSLRIGEIANRLGFGITAAFLLTLGFKPAGKEGASVLFHESEFPLICNALINHIGDVVDHHAAVEA